jgi:hypothetical protein
MHTAPIPTTHHMTRGNYYRSEVTKVGKAAQAKPTNLSLLNAQNSFGFCVHIKRKFLFWKGPSATIFESNKVSKHLFLV